MPKTENGEKKKSMLHCFANALSQAAPGSRILFVIFTSSDADGRRCDFVDRASSCCDITVCDGSRGRYSRSGDRHRQGGFCRTCRGDARDWAVRCSSYVTTITTDRNIRSRVKAWNYPIKGQQREKNVQQKRAKVYRPGRIIQQWWIIWKSIFWSMGVKICNRGAIYKAHNN